MMSVLVSGDSETKVLAKGAPDVLLSKCTHVHTQTGIKPLTNAMRKKILLQNDSMAEDALRVLGFAYRTHDTLQEENMVFLGLTGLLDPPRREAYDAVRKLSLIHIFPESH